jgi:hypothetical protein
MNFNGEIYTKMYKLRQRLFSREIIAALCEARPDIKFATLEHLIGKPVVDEINKFGEQFAPSDDSDHRSIISRYVSTDVFGVKRFNIEAYGRWSSVTCLETMMMQAVYSVILNRKLKMIKSRSQWYHPFYFNNR